MGMPRNLYMVRHGQSEGNVALDAAKNGDESHYTDEFMVTPGREWRLTGLGRSQAECAGAWLRHTLEESVGLREADAHCASPYVRARETAAHLGLHDLVGDPSGWRLSRTVRERDWGILDTLPRRVLREDYTHFHHQQQIDPLYWRPPGGESVCDVAENRVSNFLRMLEREHSGQDVVVVSHGEFIRAVMLVLLEADDEEYLRWERDPSMRLGNCEVVQFSSSVGGAVHNRFTRFRRVRPVQDPGATALRMVDSGWERFLPQRLTAEELLPSSY